MGITSESEAEIMKVYAEELQCLENKIKDLLKKTISDIEWRLIKIERSYDALGRRLEGSERHVEDEGWFD